MFNCQELKKKTLFQLLVKQKLFLVATDLSSLNSTFFLSNQILHVTYCFQKHLIRIFVSSPFRFFKTQFHKLFLEQKIQIGIMFILENTNKKINRKTRSHLKHLVNYHSPKNMSVCMHAHVYNTLHKLKVKVILKC